MFKEFKEFLSQGNVLDLAVAVVIGAGFGKIVTSLTDDIIMPLISAIFGNIDFSSMFIILGKVPATYTGSLTDYAALKAAGVPLLGYGEFITQIINFVILAFGVFMFIKAAKKARLAQDAAAPAGPTEIDLLTEIRDSLKTK